MKLKYLILCTFSLLSLNSYSAEENIKETPKSLADIGKSLQDVPKDVLLLMIRNDLSSKVKEVEEQVKNNQPFKTTLQELLKPWSGLFTSSKYFRQLYDELLKQPSIRPVLLRLTLESKLQKYVSDLNKKINSPNNKDNDLRQSKDLKEMISKPEIEPIHIIAFQNDVRALQDILPLIKELKLDLLNKNSLQEETPLIYALQLYAPHNYEFIKLLIDNGADSDIANKVGLKPLHYLTKLDADNETVKKIAQLILSKTDLKAIKQVRVFAGNTGNQNDEKWFKILDDYVKNQSQKK